MMEKEKEEIINQIENFKLNYYSTNNKNMFFKNNQKLQVAEKISNQFDLDILLEKTVYSINGSSNIYLDYTIFKLYANEYNYEKIIVYICNLIESTIEKLKKNDILLIAGKGHETYQIIGNRTVFFSDIEIARKILLLKNK